MASLPTRKFRRFPRALLNWFGKSNRKVAAVLGFDPEKLHLAVDYLCRQQPGIPVWLFSTAEPHRDTALLCERVVVCSNAAALVFQAEVDLWPRWVVFSVGTWTGARGRWLVKAAPFFIPPFRALILNAHGDFMPGTPANVLRHWKRSLRNPVKDVCSGALELASAASLLAIATVLAWCKHPQRSIFRRYHGGRRLSIPPIAEASNVHVHPYEQNGPSWDAEAFARLVHSSDARWVLCQSSPASNAPIAEMSRLFEDERTFAVSVQSHSRGWKRGVFPTAPFRKLQPDEATRLIAPLSPTILVSRAKLAALGIPECSLAITAWLLLFWKAAAAGWRCYAVGHKDPVSEEPEFPLQETSFVFNVLFNRGLRELAPREPELSRGTIAFPRSRIGSTKARPARVRVLLVSPFVPFPLSHGGAVRIFNLCRALRDRAQFGLIAVREAGDSVDYAKLLPVFENVWMIDLDEHPSENKNLPAQVRHYESSALRALVSDVSRSWSPDLLQVEYTYLASLRESAPDIPAILVEHDVTFGLYRQFALHEPSAEAEQEHQRWLKFESRWLAAYDGVWTVSDEDREEALRHGGRPENVFTVPNGVDTSRFQPADADLCAQEVLFVGSFRHSPNIIAFEKLCREVMPRVWARCPDAMLRVVAGPDYERFQRMLRPTTAGKSDSRVKVTGFVEDLRPLYARAAAVLVPLVVSSGTNIKVLEAMACAKPVVSTSVGCRGLELRDGEDVFIRDGADELARTICDLLRNESLRQHIGKNARRTVETRFSWRIIGESAFQSYLRLLDRSRRIQRTTWAG